MLQLETTKITPLMEIAKIAYAIQFNEENVTVAVNYHDTILMTQLLTRNGERDERGKTTHGERRKIRNYSRRKTKTF